MMAMIMALMLIINRGLKAIAGWVELGDVDDLFTKNTLGRKNLLFHPIGMRAWNSALARRQAPDNPLGRHYGRVHLGTCNRMTVQARYLGFDLRKRSTRSVRLTASSTKRTASTNRSSGSAQLKRRNPLPADPKHSPPKHATPF